MTAGVVSWHAAVCTLAALLVSGGLQLLTERQRQQAFRAMVSGAPEGAVVVMRHDGPGGRCISAGMRSAVSRQQSGTA